MALTLRPIKPDLYPAGAFPIPTGDQVFGVGRDVGNELRVEHASVSARHARIEVLGDSGIEVVDCGSSNGTFVNGFRVERSRLEPGDLLRFASAEFSVQESNGAASPCLAEVPAVVEEHLSRAQADGELEALGLVFEEEREALNREIAHLGEQGKAREEQLRRLQRDLEEAAAREQLLAPSLHAARREVIER